MQHHAGCDVTKTPRIFQELTNMDNDLCAHPVGMKPHVLCDATKADQACPAPSTHASISAEEAYRSLSCGICSGWIASSLVLSCGHSFCGQCLFDWINEKPSCPACQVGLRAIPVRSLALDAIVNAFEPLLPDGERINLKHRINEGHSAANKLNKMLWWLQPAAVPALGAQDPTPQAVQYNVPQQQHGAGQPNQRVPQSYRPNMRRASSGGAPPSLSHLPRAHSVTSRPMNCMAGDGDCHITFRANMAGRKSFPGLDPTVGSQLNRGAHNWPRDQSAYLESCGPVLGQGAGGSVYGNVLNQDSLFSDPVSQQQEQALFNHLCKPLPFGQQQQQTQHSFNRMHPPPPPPPPMQDPFHDPSLPLGGIGPVGAELLHHDGSSGSLELLDSYSDCSGASSLGLSSLSMQAQINQLIQSLYL